MQKSIVDVLRRSWITPLPRPRPLPAPSQTPLHKRLFTNASLLFLSISCVYTPPPPLAAGGSDAKGSGAKNAHGSRRALAEYEDSVRNSRSHEGRVERVKGLLNEVDGGHERIGCCR